VLPPPFFFFAPGRCSEW